ncbi:MAG: hypothetical protein SFW09_12450 [Hyphomicrobiaceae bacterium]|nr:hypothetical protein [Hyphomicrobiaceae bacterium]
MTSARALAGPDGRTRSPGRLHWPAWLAPHALVMGLVFAGALVVGYLLLPDDNERIAMLERDGHDKQALEFLEQRFNAGDRTHRTLFQLQSLYEARGDLPRARQLLELLAAARPRDPNVLRHLTEFYRTTQDEAGYVRALEARLALRYAQPVCKELIGIYRRAGNYDAEQRTLESCRQRGYRRPDDIIRLAQLIAADGKLAEAAVILRSVDDRRRLRDDGDRLMLFAALIESGEAEEAKRRAARWFKGSKDDALVLQIIDSLATGSRHDLAIDLAREVGKPGDSISLAVAELMLDREQIEAARSYLKGWLEAAKLIDTDIMSRMIRAALDAEDAGLAYAAATRHGLEKLQQDDLVALAEALSAIDDRTAFQAVRQLIEPAYLRENALLSAAIEVDSGKPEPARQLLSRVEVKALDEWRLALWTRLMTSTGRRATAEQTLREIAIVAGSVASVPPSALTEGESSPGAPVSQRAPSPITRPTSAIPRAGTAAEAPQVTRPDVARVPGRLIRKGRSAGPVAKGAPRRSRLKRPPAKAVPAPALGAPIAVPFPNPG